MFALLNSCSKGNLWVSGVCRELTMLQPYPVCSDVVPSFVLMAVKGNKVVTYVYELKDGEVAVSKSEFVKDSN